MFKSFIAAVALVVVMCGAVACVAGPMPAPSVSLPHAPSPSEDVVAAATALLGRPDLSGRASLSSTMSWGSKVRVVDATFEFAGDAQYERHQYENNVGDVHIGEWLSVGADEWTRTNGGRWELDARVDLRLIEAFAKMELTNVGPETADGRQVWRLRVAGTTIRARHADELDSLDLWVASDGTPVRMVEIWSYPYNDDGETLEVTQRDTYTFTDLGEPISINPPPGFEPSVP